MNERIRELALKCAQQLDWEPPADPKEYHFSDKGLNEFAELIVKECAEIALREDHDPHECILKHFGVK